jgi:hypothetical protein
MKTESSYRSPVATGQVVWIANPSSGRVAYIDAKTYQVQTVEAGDQPTYLAAVPDPTDDVAIVINVLSLNATLMRRRNPQGTLSTQTFATSMDANSWAVSSDGKWAITWANGTLVPNAPSVQGFQHIAALNLATGAATALSVGYRPSQVAFSGDTAAYVVTQDGISVVNLTASPPSITKNLPLPSAPPPPPPAVDASSDGSPEGAVEATTPVVVGDDASSGPSATSPDVSFTSDGAYALVRIDGIPSITIIALQDGSRTTVPLPSPPTDLTLSPHNDFAMAVLRDLSEVVTLPLPGIVSNPSLITSTAIPGETIGRAIITKDGNSALLFTTAAPVDRMTVLTLKPTPTFRTITLHAPVLAVFPTDDGGNAVVLHNVSTTPLGQGVEGAFSLVPIALDVPAVIVPVPAPPTSVALTPKGDYALVSVRDDAAGTYGLFLGMMPSLQALSLPLASAPIAVGIAAGAARGYVAQDFPEGRITFVDLSQSACDGSPQCLSARTISGFELGASVVNGSTP